MAKLVWDAAGQRFYETGVKQGVLYVQNSDGTYPEGVAWNGLTTVTESPSGAEANPQYADDIKYLNLYSAEEFGATIEAFTYPVEWEECDGSRNINGVKLGQQGRKSFGLCYRTAVGNDIDGSEHAYKLHLIYGAQASPSEKSYTTINDSPEPITFSWEVTTTPTNVTGYKPTSQITIDSRDVGASTMAALEDILYGTVATTASLPSPEEVIALVRADVYDITLNHSNLAIKVDDEVALQATTTPANETVSWQSSNTSYATVTNGVVKGIAAGTATITASFTGEDTNTYSDTCTVVVSAKS